MSLFSKFRKWAAPMLVVGGISSLAGGEAAAADNLAPSISPKACSVVNAVQNNAEEPSAFSIITSPIQSIQKAQYPALVSGLMDMLEQKESAALLTALVNGDLDNQALLEEMASSGAENVVTQVIGGGLKGNALISTLSSLKGIADTTVQSQQIVKMLAEIEVPGYGAKDIEVGDHAVTIFSVPGDYSIRPDDHNKMVKNADNKSVSINSAYYYEIKEYQDALDVETQQKLAAQGLTSENDLSVACKEVDRDDEIANGNGYGKQAAAAAQTDDIEVILSELTLSDR